MTDRPTLFFESTCTILGCTSEFWSVYGNDKLATDVTVVRVMLTDPDTVHANYLQVVRVTEI